MLNQKYKYEIWLPCIFLNYCYSELKVHSFVCYEFHATVYVLGQSFTVRVARLIFLLYVNVFQGKCFLCFFQGKFVGAIPKTYICIAVLLEKCLQCVFWDKWFSQLFFVFQWICGSLSLHTCVISATDQLKVSISLIEYLFRTSSAKLSRLPCFPSYNIYMLCYI